MKITFSSPKLGKTDTLVIGVGENKQLGAQGKEADKATKSLIKRTISGSRFGGKIGQAHILHTSASAPYDRVVLLGLGKGADLKALAAEKAGAALSKTLDSAGIKSAAVAVEAPKGCKLSDAELAAHIAYGALLKNYRFDKYFTQLKPEQKQALNTLKFHTDGAAKAKTAFADLEAVAEGAFFTRDLVSEPGNVIFPESLAKRCKELTKLGVKVEVLTKAQMEKLGMGALLGVAQGSVNEAKMVIMRWDGGKKSDKPVAIVGKGVTFDTGGISLKPGAGMEEMKWDMGGSGVTIGLMKAIAGRKAKVNVVGVVGAVENMPDGNAQRPGDVVKTMSGQTVEVINTDAEGRLVLADALWYTQDRFKPKAMINLATLTGAIIIALGKRRAGVFSNNDKLAKQLEAAGQTEGEIVWRLPIGDEYESHIKSDIADMKNVGKGREAGSISAAQFLERYVNNVPWAHIDIAGTTWTNEELDFARKGATGFGVRLLNRFIAENYE